MKAFYNKTRVKQCYLMLNTCYGKFPSKGRYASAVALWENPGEVTVELFSYVNANYFEDAAVLCIGLTDF